VQACGLEEFFDLLRGDALGAAAVRHAARAGHDLLDEGPGGVVPGRGRGDHAVAVEGGLLEQGFGARQVLDADGLHAGLAGEVQDLAGRGQQALSFGVRVVDGRQGE
jgi:hypothetical protein